MVGDSELSARTPTGRVNFSPDLLMLALRGDALGVINLRETERISHYFNARLADQFDAVVHMDQTRAVEPLERTSQWETGEFPETYPFAV